MSTVVSIPVSSLHVRHDNLLNMVIEKPELQSRKPYLFEFRRDLVRLGQAYCPKADMRYPFNRDVIILVGLS